MTCRRISRRDFAKRTLLGTAAAFSLEERQLLAKPATEPLVAQPVQFASKNKLPTGKIGNLEISRLILGGNLMGGFAHSRDLMYVSDLLKHYFTPEKIMDTLQLAEEHGITCVNTNTHSTAVMQRYWKERGGKIKWLVQGDPKSAPQGDLNNDDGFASIKASIDAGADAIYIQGNEGDGLTRKGKADLIGRALEFIKQNGLPAGVGGHEIRTMRCIEQAGIAPDFYVKTLHQSNYWSSRRPDQNKDVIDNWGVDNYFCKDLEETIQFMAALKRPWIAFKVMAAGAIRPKPAFQHAFDSGADFILTGIFDFQIADDVRIARDALAQVNRTRPWLA